MLRGSGPGLIPAATGVQVLDLVDVNAEDETMKKAGRGSGTKGAAGSKPASPPRTHGSRGGGGKRQAPSSTRATGSGSRAPRKPAGWDGAEFLHMQLHAGSMMPFVSASPPEEEKVEAWCSMIARCRHFYPAQFELGIHLVKTGHEQEGRAHIDQGLTDFVRLSEHPEEEVTALVENLEQAWRYDLVRISMEQFVARWPEVGWFHDELAHAAARVGDFATARSAGKRALELVPDAAGFLSNSGLCALLEGRLEDAGRHIDRALTLEPKQDTGRRNRRVLKYLREHGGRYTDYLLRPAPRAELDRLANEEDSRTLERKAGEINWDRIEAFGQDGIEQGQIARVADQISTVKVLFGFLAGVSADAYFLFEDAAFMRGIFERLMNRFILKFTDADAALIEEVCTALDTFYAFLVRRRVLSGRDLAAFQKTAGPVRKKLLDRATRYAKARRDKKLGEDEREALRDELFDGDHFWPHI